METPRDRDDQLVAELRALRPTPQPQFTAELDERAAAGFPRRSRLPRFSFSRLRAVPARRLLLPAGGLAVLAIVIATAAIATRDTQDTPSVGDSFLSLSAPESESDSPPAAAPEFAGEASSAAGGGEALDSIERSSGSGGNRAVERSAELVLGASPADVAENSAEVFDVVHAHNGIVTRSSTREGEPGEAEAHFELLIPSARLSDALAALSTINEVRSRYETTADITAPTVNVTEQLQDSRARIDSLLGQLAEAETESEREAVEAELRQERRHRARLRASLQDLQRRADLSRVLVLIETDASEQPSSDGAWGVDNALDDAGEILAIAAAIAIVSLTVIGPFALIGLLAWLAHRAWVRRQRHRALD
jgi:hypothetical protein